ncbi:long-chain-fatty-acid--CoA ligase ACSBG2-like isoform X7 [Zalophus californianus]|uniref:long-chain-fatty-acid--CoA ligase n=1 Tax=Zalophus californianus TaxID=9704 RepID=A0A6P9ETI8_ZALCA|nr:long-chain-fatty-acid--CoA ligase ACSBG2-like isoform X7 [Zalophus californianus]
MGGRQGLGAEIFQLLLGVNQSAYWVGDGHRRRPDAPQTVRREAEDTLHTMSSLKTLSLTERDHQREIKAKGHPYWTSKRDGEVHLRQEDAFTSQAPITVHDMVMNTAIKYANYIALGSKHRNGWHLLTYIEYYEECRRAAKAFLKLGLERFHSVGIMGLNSEEWAIASIGAIMAGGFSVGILSTSSPKACQVIAESSEMDIFVVDNDRQLQKIIQIQGSLKHLKAIVQYKEEIRTWLQNLYSTASRKTRWIRSLTPKSPTSAVPWSTACRSQAPPKAMMLSHDNITWTTVATAQRLSYKCPPEEQEILVSYLPLSYMGAQLFDMWVSISVAGALYFAQPDALRGSLIDTLREVKPTLFHGVPWVWDRLLDNLKTDQLSSTPFRRRMDQWAMWLGLRTNRKRMFNCGKSLPNTHTKTQKHNEEGIGDIYIWGRNIFMGYLNDEENTQEKIDAHGWLHTGDLGFLDTDEFLYVVGNARDIITLSSGERINPNPIEERVKRYIPIVRYVVLVGQDAPYLCALLTLKCQVNTDTGEPRNALTSEAVAFCRQLRSQSTRLSDIVYDGDPVVLEFISQGIDAANAEVPSDSAKIIKWTILRTDFSMVGGELGATTKLKRAMVARMYQAEIERLYEEADDED